MPVNNLISAPVLEVFVNNRDIEITLNQLVKETGFEGTRIKAAISHMRAKGIKLDQVLKGQCWIYRSTPNTPLAKAPQEEPQAKVMTRAEERLKLNQDNRPPVGSVVPAFVGNQPVIQPKTGQFIMPKPNKDNEFMRVVSRTTERVLLEDAEGKVWRATEI